jgi:hypothetical protein
MRAANNDYYQNGKDKAHAADPNIALNRKEHEGFAFSHEVFCTDGIGNADDHTHKNTELQYNRRDRHGYTRLFTHILLQCKSIRF